MKKLLSLVLAMVMVWGLLPASAPTANAADTSVGLLQLMRGFNVLSGKELTNLTTTNNLLKAGAGNLLADYYDYTTGTETDTSAAWGKSMVDFALNAGIDISLSTEANVGYGKLFKASASTKFKMNNKYSYADSTESYFYRYSINHTEGKNEIKNFDAPATKRTIQQALDSTFLNDLKNADIHTVFQKYGTHIITSYAMGGWSEYTASTVSNAEKMTAAIATKYETTASASGSLYGVTAGAKASAGLGLELDTTLSNADSVSSSSNQTKGGVGGITFSSDEKIVTDTYNAWLKSFTPANSYILLDDYLELRGIWELLPDGYEARQVQMQNEYIRRSVEQDKEFYNEFVYKATQKGPAYLDAEVLDIDQYNPTGVQPITISSEAEFAAIGSAGYPRDGDYILMKELDFASYSSLETFAMQTLQEVAFTGTFDGNGNKIKNFKPGYKKPQKQNGYAGLFPINEGIIKNLIIENAEIIWDNFSGSNRSRAENIPNPVYRAGVITGLNGTNGRIENCRVKDSKVNVTLFTGGIEYNVSKVYGGGIAGKTKALYHGLVLNQIAKSISSLLVRKKVIS